MVATDILGVVVRVAVAVVVCGDNVSGSGGDHWTAAAAAATVAIETFRF